MITTADLKTQTRRDLVELAKQLGVSGWHSMRKDDLISELTRLQRNQRRRAAAKAAIKSEDAEPPANLTAEASKKTANRSSPVNRVSASKTSRTAKPKSPTAASIPPAVSAASRRASQILSERHEQSVRDKDLSSSMLVSGNSIRSPSPLKNSKQDSNANRIALIVRDSYWLQASWEISRAAVERASASMSEHWHSARPILRVFRVSDGAGANATEQWWRDISIHGGVNTWYIDVDKPGHRYRVVIGYLSDGGRLFTIARSNLVETPQPGSCDMIEGHWKDIAEDYERIYAISGGNDAEGDLKSMFEDRLQRPMSDVSFGAGADVILRRDRDLPFKVDAELIVFGKTVPGTSVTLAGEPVRLHADGSFTVRVELPDRRRVLPVVASSRDGIRQRTTVIAVERNTKVMESVTMDEDE